MSATAKSGAARPDTAPARPEGSPAQDAADGRVLRSPLLAAAGVRHGFTTRLGGVSEGRFASLNVGQTWGDDPARAAENLARVAGAGGFALDALCQVAQVHGTDVLLMTAPERRQRQADGMATDRALTLGTLSADCVSILLADGRGRVAAVHAGWRGTVAGIARRAVEALAALGAPAESLLAALGPSIGPCCFEVQADVAGQFAAVCAEAVTARDGRRYVDLWRTNRHFLEAAGVPPARIDAAPPCTCCDPRRFYSYRRDGAGIGQHLAFILGGTA